MSKNWCAESKADEIKEILTKPDNGSVRIYHCACANCSKETVIMTFDADRSDFPRFCPICRSAFGCAL